MALFGLELPLVLVLAGLGLMIAEAMSPGAHLIVLGVALLVAGLVGTFVSPLATPIALAGMTLLFGAGALFVYREFDLYASGDAGQTSDSDSLRGHTGRVVDRVTETDGRVKLRGGGFNPYYQARAVEEPIEPGEEVIVVEPGGGNVLTVAAMDAVDDGAIERELARGEDDDGPGSSGGDGPDSPGDGGDGSAADADADSGGDSGGSDADAAGDGANGGAGAEAPGTASADEEGEAPADGSAPSTS